jgi:hypothetical protein
VAEPSINDPEEGYGIEAPALASLPVRAQVAAAGGDMLVAHEAKLAAASAAHTEQQVLATQLVPQRLKGINEELPLVALAFGDEDGLGCGAMHMVPLRNTVDPAIQQQRSGSGRANSLRHLVASSSASLQREALTRQSSSVSAAGAGRASAAE